MTLIKLGTPIPVRLYEDDQMVIQQVAKDDERNQSVLIRKLVHKAIMIEAGIDDDSVRVDVIGKLNNHTVIDQVEEQ